MQLGNHQKSFVQKEIVQFYDFDSASQSNLNAYSQYPSRRIGVKSSHSRRAQRCVLARTGVRSAFFLYCVSFFCAHHGVGHQMLLYKHQGDFSGPFFVMIKLFLQIVLCTKCLYTGFRAFSTCFADDTEHFLITFRVCGTVAVHKSCRFIGVRSIWR